MRAHNSIFTMRNDSATPCRDERNAMQPFSGQYGEEEDSYSSGQRFIHRRYRNAACTSGTSASARFDAAPGQLPATTTTTPRPCRSFARSTSAANTGRDASSAWTMKISAHSYTMPASCLSRTCSFSDDADSFALISHFDDAACAGRPATFVTHIDTFLYRPSPAAFNTPFQT